MPDTADQSEKTENATPHHIQKAREEGQVARSRELTTWLLLGAAVVGLYGMGTTLATSLAGVAQSAFLFGRSDAFDPRVMMANARSLFAHAVLGWAPFFLLLTVVALAAPLLIGGWIASSKAMTPQISRLDPLQGFKRMLSTQTLAELGKGIFKSLLVGAVIWWFVSTKQGSLIALLDGSTAGAALRGMDLIRETAAFAVLALAVVAAIDVPYQLWSNAKKLRMTKDELKREFKETDGDPHTKSRIRSVRQTLARRRMMKRVAEADVVIVNPTHYAVALRYAEARMRAPRVIAKGVDAVAARIRQLAAEHDIPQLEAPPLARALYWHVDLDREIPAALYDAVAQVLVWAMALRGGVEAASPTGLGVPEGMDTDHRPPKRHR